MKTYHSHHQTILHGHDRRHRLAAARRARLRVLYVSVALCIVLGYYWQAVS